MWFSCKSVVCVAAVSLPAATSFVALGPHGIGSSVSKLHDRPFSVRTSNKCSRIAGTQVASCGAKTNLRMQAFDFGKMWEELGNKFGIPSTVAKESKVYDAAIIGYGPAGGVMATLLAEKHGLNVCVIDPVLERRWVPNYGVWVEEWEALEKDLQIGLGSCLEHTWEVTDSYFGGSHGVDVSKRTRLNRSYARVSRDKYQANLKKRLDDAGVVKIKGRVDASKVTHSPQGSEFALEDGTTVSCRVMVDCSGHKSELIERDGPHNPGVQIAYGIECEVKDGHAPYDENAMLFMDYRTNYLEGEDALDPAKIKSLTDVPTFLYAMPLGKASNGRSKIFFEETSLVARPAISFDLCKERLYKRLAHHGIEVAEVFDEELCYIPMGGAFPKMDQRVIAFGGAGGLVHAATGYMQVRMLAAAGGVASAIAKELKAGSASSPDVASKRAYQAMWPAKARLQRDFHVFGGEFLMAQDVSILRGFFEGFFKLPIPLWGSFLSGYPGLPHNELQQTWQDRFNFGFQFFLKLAPTVKATLALAGALNGWQYGLLRSVTPLADSEEAVDWKVDSEIEAFQKSVVSTASVDVSTGPTVASEGEIGDAVEVAGELTSTLVEKELVEG